MHLWFKSLAFSVFVKYTVHSSYVFMSRQRLHIYLYLILTPEIYLCIWKTPDRLSSRLDLWGYYGDLPHDEITRAKRFNVAKGRD